MVHKNCFQFFNKRNLLIFIIYSCLLRYIVKHVISLSNVPIHYQNNISIPKPDFFNKPQLSSNTTLPTRTLVVYVYGETHTSAADNLAFFIRTAVRASHDADYYFILQQIGNKVFNLETLPSLPPNAHYIQHEDKCFDLGTIGWFLSTDTVNKNNYKYFIFLNSSVRGPFIVSYYYDPVWYTIFTRRLNDYIRLVGCTFSCDPSAHIQSYLWAMNPHTFDVLMSNSRVFTCHKTLQDTIDNGEVAASRFIREAGYGIDSLMTKYRGLDVRAHFMTNCPYWANPTVDGAVDRITLDPYEVVFVKIKADHHLFQRNLQRVGIYEKWLNQ